MHVTSTQTSSACAGQRIFAGSPIRKESLMESIPHGWAIQLFSFNLRSFSWTFSRYARLKHVTLTNSSRLAGNLPSDLCLIIKMASRPNERILAAWTIKFPSDMITTKFAQTCDLCRCNVLAGTGVIKVATYVSAYACSRRCIRRKWSLRCLDNLISSLSDTISANRV